LVGAVGRGGDESQGGVDGACAVGGGPGVSTVGRQQLADPLGEVGQLVGGHAEHAVGDQGGNPPLRGLLALRGRDGECLDGGVGGVQQGLGDRDGEGLGFGGVGVDLLERDLPARGGRGPPPLSGVAAGTGGSDQAGGVELAEVPGARTRGQPDHPGALGRRGPLDLGEQVEHPQPGRVGQGAQHRRVSESGAPVLLIASHPHTICERRP